MEGDRAANQRSAFLLSFTLALYISNGFGLRTFLGTFRKSQSEVEKIQHFIIAVFVVWFQKFKKLYSNTEILSLDLCDIEALDLPDNAKENLKKIEKIIP